MARLLGWIVGLPLALLAVMFAVANRHDVRLDLWPLPWSLEVPAYLATLGSLVAGILIGALVTWASTLPVRRRAAVQRRRADSLQRQLDAEHTRAALPGPADHGA